MRAGRLRRGREDYSCLTEDMQSASIDLRRQIALLQKDEERLQWLLSATFARAEVKAKAALDLRHNSREPEAAEQ